MMTYFLVSIAGIIAMASIAIWIILLLIAYTINKNIDKYLL